MGMVMMLWGSNSRTVVIAAKERLEEINKTLPKGVVAEVTYDRAELINRTLHTVQRNLLEGGTLVIIVLLVMLGSLRAGIVVAMAIPLSMLFAANMMSVTGITASLMSLGAIDFGATEALITKLMGKGEAAARRELMELHGDSVEIDV